jgi:hypothetical protein
LQHSPELTPDRLGDRASLMRIFDDAERRADQVRAAGAFDDYRSQAFVMLTSARARTMFDLDREPRALRDSYGRAASGSRACTPAGSSSMACRSRS